jgi:hypothetical protein
MKKRPLTKKDLGLCENVWVVYAKDPKEVWVGEQNPQMFSTEKLAKEYQKENGGFVVVESATADLVEDLKKEEAGGVDHDYKCSCGKPATYNIGSTTTVYDITNDGDFNEYAKELGIIDNSKMSY